ncbi:DNA pilot protein [Dipodfec virus UA23Rod_872]|uniref:DNA pilot protein n=1 Tax=Dipodfec virus UA23Rod_872 TaxID=2929333 RepID=A0A976R866_9VIRU|nr:DNA pilot protein [Dipodfec virus UA23Rod_872]
MSDVSSDKNKSQSAGSSSWTPTASQQWLTSPPWMGSTSSRSIRSMREQNYNSRMMLSAEQDFNREMAQYYDAAHVARRYVDAGINPMLAMSGQSLGTAGSSSPQGSVPQPSSTENGGFQPILDSIGAVNNSAAQFVDAMRAQPEIKGKQLQNQYDMLSLFDRLMKTKEDANQAGFDTEYKSIRNYIAEETKDSEVDRIKWEKNLTIERANEASSNGIYLMLKSQWEPTKMNAEVDLIRKQIAELGARILVHKSQAKWYDASSYEAFMSGLEHFQRANGLLLDNRLKSALFGEYVKQGYLATIHAANNAGAENEFQSWYNMGVMLGGTREAGLITQSVIAGLHEIEDVSTTVSEVISDLKSVGVKDTPTNRRYIEDMVNVRKEQLESFGVTSTSAPPRAGSKRNR